MVIALHNRGTGKSSRPNYPYTMDMFIDDIKDVLEHLNIQEKIHLAGISMGGMIVQNFILKYPEMVKTLILCATTAKHEFASLNNLIEAQELMDNFSLEQKFKIRVSALFSRPFRKRLRANKELYNNIKNEFIEDPTNLQDYKNQGAAISKHNTINSLNKITQPTLILVGDDDRIIVGLSHSELLYEKIPNSRLEIIKNTGHGFIVEASDEINNIIWNFIKENLD